MSELQLRTQTEYMNDRDYVSVAQAAEIKGVSIKTIHQWINAGRSDGTTLKAETAIGGAKFIKKDDLAQFNRKGNAGRRPWMKVVMALEEDYRANKGAN